MNPNDLLLLAGLILGGVHFGVPLVYYAYLKRTWLPRTWDIKKDPGYTPRISIIIPTYLAARHISKRLDNIAGQNYPLGRLEVIVVDSASPDGTANIVERWIKTHPEFKVKLIVETKRSGKFEAVARALRHISKDSDIIVLTDDDCLWDSNALMRIASYFSDSSVAAATGSIRYLGDDGVHNAYRDLYNQIRIAESKWWSTPVHNGPLLALRKEVIEKIGLPTLPGADDSAFASYTAFAGYRAIQADDAWVYEYPARDQHKRMIRRATHLVIYFTNLKKYAKKNGVYVKSPFDKIWNIEAYLHTINPLILLIAGVILSLLAVWGNSITLILLGLATVLLVYKPYRAWMTSQLYLLIGLIRAFTVKQETWPRPKLLQR